MSENVEQEHVSTWKTATICGCGAERKAWRPYCPRCTRARRVNYAELPSAGKQRANARSYLNQYLRRGKIAKLPCAECGAHDVEAHHADYAQPLEVTWLCRPCHLRLHGVAVVRRPKGSKADAGKPPELFAFYESLHARGLSTEILASRLLVHGCTVRKLIVGLQAQRGATWRGLLLQLTDHERELLATASKSAWIANRDRPRWTTEKAADIAARRAVA